MRRVISIIMSMMLLVGMVSLAADDTNQPVTTTMVTTGAGAGETRAEALNALNILRGNGSGYNLSGQLSRAEAATFIVRMIGMEAEVLANKGTYLQMAFSDVASHEWFAPYVGYCYSIGVIGGFEDGTFKPKDFVSEKAFLKMLMTAMGYVYNTDFTWDQVYAKAYELGVVADLAYALKTGDDYAYTRGDVVYALFDTLKANKKGSDEKMVQYFLNQGIMTPETAAAFGLIKDAVKTQVESVTMLSDKTLEVVFNEGTKPLELTDLLVTDKADTTKQYAMESVEVGADATTARITLSKALLPDRDYTVFFDQVTDLYGETMNLLTGHFKGFRQGTYTSEYFMISDIESLSATQLEVTFTHPINDNMTNPTYYTLEQGGLVLGKGSDYFSVALSAENNRKIIVTLKNISLQDQGSYRLLVDGKAISAYTVGVLNGAGDFIDFMVDFDTPLAFSLNKIETISPATIILKFTEEVNPILGEQVYNYYVTNDQKTPIQVTKAVVSGKQVTLSLNTSLVATKTYQVMINQLNDITKANYIREESHTFVVAFEEKKDVTILSAKSSDAGVIILTLSGALDESSATERRNYSVVGVSGTSYSQIPDKVYYDPKVNPTEVVLFMPRYQALTKDGQYKVTLLKGTLSGDARPQTVDQSNTFKASSSIVIGVFIKDAVVVGDNTIKLTFTKEIALDVPNVLNTNYTLYYEVGGTTLKKVPLSANYIDPLTMILKVDDLTKGIAYQVTFDSLTDYAGNGVANPNQAFRKDIRFLD